MTFQILIKSQSFTVLLQYLQIFELRYAIPEEEEIAPIGVFRISNHLMITTDPRPLYHFSTVLRVPRGKNDNWDPAFAHLKAQFMKDNESDDEDLKSIKSKGSVGLDAVEGGGEEGEDNENEDDDESIGSITSAVAGTGTGVLPPIASVEEEASDTKQGDEAIGAILEETSLPMNSILADSGEDSQIILDGTALQQGDDVLGSGSLAEVSATDGLIDAVGGASNGSLPAELSYVSGELGADVDAEVIAGSQSLAESGQDV